MIGFSKVILGKRVGDIKTLTYIGARFGQIWLIGRAWLVQPSEGHDETDFLGIKYCSTYKKVPKNPQTEREYFNDDFRSAFCNGEQLAFGLDLLYHHHHLWLRRRFMSTWKAQGAN